MNKKSWMISSVGFLLISSAFAGPNTRQCSNFDGSWTTDSRLHIGGAMPPPGAMERSAHLKHQGTVVGTMEQRVGQGETWTGSYRYQTQSTTLLNERMTNPGCFEMETVDVIEISSMPTDGSVPTSEIVHTICKEERCFYP